MVSKLFLPSFFKYMFKNQSLKHLKCLFGLFFLKAIRRYIICEIKLLKKRSASSSIVSHCSTITKHISCNNYRLTTGIIWHHLCSGANQNFGQYSQYTPTRSPSKGGRGDYSEWEVNVRVSAHLSSKHWHFNVRTNREWTNTEIGSEFQLWMTGAFVLPHRSSTISTDTSS